MDILEALDKLKDPVIILNLMKYGFDRNLKVSYYDTLHDDETKTYITVRRYKTIENIILEKYYLSCNDRILEIKAVERYKQKYQVTPSKRTGTAVKKKTHNAIIELSSDSDEEVYFPTAEEIQRHNEMIGKNINERVRGYCEIFKINLQELLERGEEYPDELGIE